MNNYRRVPIVLTKGKGVYIYDSRGKKYLDLLSGLAINSLGYSPKVVTKAIEEQSIRLIHSSNLYYEKNQLDYAKFLIRHTCFEKVFFCNSASEGNDAAIKIARKYSYQKYGDEKRFEIIAMENGFHGRTAELLAQIEQWNG